MFTDYIFSILTIAGIAVLWRNLLHDLPKLKQFTHSLPWFFRKALNCGFCFTFWISLFFVIIFNPLHDWLPPFRFYIPYSFLLNILCSWMTVGIGAVIIRFGYVALQELVHYQVHELNREEGHSH